MIDGPPMMQRVESLLAVAGLILGLAAGCANVSRRDLVRPDSQPASATGTGPSSRRAADSNIKRSAEIGRTRVSDSGIALAAAADLAGSQATGPPENLERQSPPAQRSADADDDDSSDGVMNSSPDDDAGEQPPSPDDADNSDDATPEEPQDESQFLKVIEPSTDDEAPKRPEEGVPSRPDGPSTEVRRFPIGPSDIGLQPGPELKSGKAPTKLHLDDVDVRKVLETMSREHGLNMLVSPSVSGRVTADLSNLTLGQALNAILKSCNLAARHENGVIYVYTPEEMKEQNSRSEDDKVGLRIYQMNYVRSTDLLKILKPFLSPDGKMTATPASQVGVRPINPISGQTAGGGGGSSGGGGGGGGGGGAGGNQVSVSGGDALATQEAILIEDRESILRKTDQIIKKLDVQPQQVLIEAVILYVTHNHSSELGVNFGVINNSGQVLSLVGDGAAINAASGFSPASVIANGLLNTPASGGGSGSSGGGSSSGGGGGGGFGTDTQGFKFGNSSKHLTSFITALETVGNVEVLATPKLLVINKQLAELQLGDRLGYSTLSQSIVSTTQQIQFMNVGTLLRVRPFISTDGMVRMEVHPERSTGAIVNSIPQASTAEVTTNVLVPDGATLIIGGLMDRQNEFDQSGVPWFDRIPYVGALFRTRTRTSTKKELVVMLTTHIWNPNAECPIPGAGGAALEEIARPMKEALPSP